MVMSESRSGFTGSYTQAVRIKISSLGGVAQTLL